MDMGVQNEAVQFGDFRFDRRDRRLARRNASGGWQSVALGSRAMDMLNVLLDRPCQVVSKETIMNAVWPGLVVEPNNLTVQ